MRRAVKHYIDNWHHQHLDGYRVNREGEKIYGADYTEVLSVLPCDSEDDIRVQVIKITHYDEHTITEFDKDGKPLHSTKKREKPAISLNVALVVPSIDCVNNRGEELVCLFDKAFGIMYAIDDMAEHEKALTEALDYARYLQKYAAEFFKKMRKYELLKD